MDRLTNWIAVDFDHTLVDHDVALEGAKEAINILRERGFKIMIHSCNNTEWIKKVLHNLDIRYDAIWEKPGKPICEYYIDDRAIHFTGDWKAVLKEVGSF